MKKSIKYLPVLALLLVIGLYICYFNSNKNNVSDIYSDNLSYSDEIKEDNLLDEYNNCLSDTYNTYDDTPYLAAMEEKLTAYLENYNVSVAFKDINTGYTYEYNSDKTYYAASTIKMLDAIYIYWNAYNGKIVHSKRMIS